MKVIVAGSRSFDDYEEVCKAIEKAGVQIDELVHGDAKGVDRLAGKWAEQNNIPVRKFPAEWKNMTLPNAKPKQYAHGKGMYNSTAGFYRNQRMAEYGDYLIAVDLDTGGTNDMIERMEKLGKPIFKYFPYVDNEEDYVF